MTELIKITLILAISSALSLPLIAQENEPEQIRVPNNILSGEALGEFMPDEPENGNILALYKNFFTSNDEHYSVGIYQGKQGSMTVKNQPYAEIMYIVEGSIQLNTGGNSPISYTAGEGVVIPKGWTGTFTIPEGGFTGIYSVYNNENMQAAPGAEIILLDRDTIDGKRFSDFRAFDPDVSDIVARNHEFYRSEDQKFGIDVWEAQPGEVPFADLGYDEMIYVLDGNMSFIDMDGDAQIYSEGKAVILPQGWNGKGVVSTSGARVLIFWHLHGERQ